jgi:hypothetical protein
LLNSLIEDAPDRDRLAPEFLAILGTDRWSELRRRLKDMGPIGSMTHLGTESSDHTRRRRYRAASRESTAHNTFVLTPRDEFDFLIVERE